MRVTVKLFASYRELAGTSQLSLDLPDGATLGDALDEVARLHPAIASAVYRPVAACNLRHATRDRALREGDEVAMFPPVSGG